MCVPKCVSCEGASTQKLPLTFDGWSACNHQHHIINGDGVWCCGWLAGGRWMGIGHLSWVMSNKTVYDTKWYEPAIKAFSCHGQRTDRCWTGSKQRIGGLILCKWVQSGVEISFIGGGLWRNGFNGSVPNRRRRRQSHRSQIIIVWR